LDSFRLILLSTLIGGMAGATVLAGVLDQVGIVTDALTGRVLARSSETPSPTGGDTATSRCP
jgi:hypothetical protein